MHGGASPVGIAHPRYVHGRYSRVMPQRLQERYELAASDPQLLSVTEEIRVIDARIGDLLQRVDGGEAGEHWQGLRRTLDYLAPAIAAKDANRVAGLLSELDQIATAGNADYSAWQEVFDAIEARRRLVETERRRMAELDQNIPAERAFMMIGAILEIIRRWVTDPQQLRGIAADIRALTSSNISDGVGGE